MTVATLVSARGQSFFNDWPRRLKGLYFYGLLVATYFDPQNALRLRPVFTYSLLPLWVYAAFEAARNPVRYRATLVLGIVGPAWGCFMYALRGQSSVPFTDTSYMMFAVTYSLVFLMRDPRDQALFERASLVVGTLFAGTIVLTAVELLTNSGSVLRDFLLSNEIARVSFREYAGIQIPYVYFYASTFLMMPMALLLERFRRTRPPFVWHAIYVLMAITLFLSGTRSHIVLAALFLGAYVMILGRTARRLGVALVIVILVMSRSSLQPIADDMFSRSEGNNDVKLSMGSTYERMLGDPVTLAFGQGFQAVSWSPELRAMLTADGDATKTELTYLELVRVYGLPIAALHVIVLAGLIWQAYLQRRAAKVTTIAGLLLDSLLNPHLFSSYGAVMMAFGSSPPSLLPMEPEAVAIPAQRLLRERQEGVRDAGRQHP